MDLGLPVIDGWEATRRLKADASTQHIPIIVLSAHAMTNDRDLALAAGGDDFDTKPVRFEPLIDKITTLLARLHRPMTRQGSLLVVDDNDDNRDALSRRLRQKGYLVSVAADGAGALAQIDREPYDLVLLDVEMPGMSGLEVLSQVSRPAFTDAASSDHGHCTKRRGRHRRGLRSGRQRLRHQASRFRRRAGAHSYASGAQVGGRRPPRERGAVRARRPGGQRRVVGLESRHQRGLLVRALESDARLRRARDWHEPRRVVQQSAPRGPRARQGRADGAPRQRQPAL